MNLDDFKAYKTAQAEGKFSKVTFWENRLLSDNDKLTMDLCNKYRRGLPPSVALEDAEQAARIGMLKTIRKWDPALGTLSNFAGWQILHELQSLAKREDPLMDGFLGRRHRPANRKIEAYVAKHGKLGTPEEMGVKPEALVTFEFEPRYIHAAFMTREASELGLSAVEALPDEAPNALEQIVAREEACEAIDKVPSSRQIPVWVLAQRPAYVRFTSNLLPDEKRVLEDLEKSGDTAARVARRHHKTKAFVMKLWKRVESEVRDFWHEGPSRGV